MRDILLQNNFAVSATQKKVTLGHIINNLHEKVHISVPLLTNELAQEDTHYIVP